MYAYHIPRDPSSTTRVWGGRAVKVWGGRAVKVWGGRVEQGISLCTQFFARARVAQ